MDKWHSATGILKYFEAENHYNLVAEVDQGIVEFYRSLIPKYLGVNKPRYKAHITVVRSYKEVPKDFTAWKKHQGETINFKYNSYIHNNTNQDNKMYYWLNALSIDLEDIREELGLTNQFFNDELPKGYKKFFHITLGNRI